MSNIIGAFESVKIDGLASGGNFGDSLEILAKIDTGAFSGAIHAGNIQENDGVLSFDLMGDEKFHLETSEYLVRRVRNTHGGVKRRYFTKLKIRVSGEEYEALLGLDDRSRMKFDMLLGRAFLNKNSLIVDVHKSIELDEEWKRMEEWQ